MRFFGGLMHYRQLHLNTSHNELSFLLPLFPFVCRNIPFVKPSVCLIYPFVVRNQKTNGFTLIELIITLTVVGILLAIIAPNFSTFLSSNRLTTQANELLTDLSFARSESIKQATNIGVCVSNGSSCMGSDWRNGWIVFLDADNSASWTSGDSVLRVHDALTGATTATTSSAIIVFSRSGMLANGTGAGSYTLCDSGTSQSRVITITSVGRVTLTKGAC